MKKKSKVIMFSILIVMAFSLTQVIASFIGSIFISAQFINSGLNSEEIQTKISQTLSNNATIISVIGNIIFLVLGILIYKIKKKKITEEINLKQICLKDLLIPVIAIITYSISFNLIINILPIPASAILFGLIHLMTGSILIVLFAIINRWNNIWIII